MSMKFFRQDMGRHNKLNRKKKRGWRKPKGSQSKVRLCRKGHEKMVSIGYRSPRSDRGKINGERVFLIKSIRDFENVKGAAIIASVGSKKRKQLLEEAAKRKIKVLNLKNKQEEKK